MLKLLGFLFILVLLYLTFGLVLEIAKMKREDIKGCKFDMTVIERLLFWPKQIL